MLVHVVDATGRSDRDGNALGGHEIGKYKCVQVIILVRITVGVFKSLQSGSSFSSFNS